jgi:hypothetical protein
MANQATKPSNSSTNQPSSNSGRNASEAKQVATEKLQAYGTHYVAEPAQDLASQLIVYAKRKPDVAAMWCFGLGVIVGWKLRG